MLENVIKELEAYGENVISKAKNKLRKNNNTGALSESLKYELKDTDTDKPKIVFTGEEYGNFLDLGVQGNDPEAQPRGAKIRFNRAPNSPYQFGTGTGTSGGLRNAIDKWVLQRGGFKVRDEKGRFINRKSMVFLITRSIWNTGLEPTYFFRDAQDEANRSLKKGLAKALTKDVSKIVKRDIRKNKNFRLK